MSLMEDILFRHTKPHREGGRSKICQVIRLSVMPYLPSNVNNNIHINSKTIMLDGIQHSIVKS